MSYASGKTDLISIFSFPALQEISLKNSEVKHNIRIFLSRMPFATEKGLYPAGFIHSPRKPQNYLNDIMLNRENPPFR